MYIHACRHVTNPLDSYIKYLTLLVLNKQKLENQIANTTSHLNKYNQKHPKNKPYNMLPKPTQIARMKDTQTPQESPHAT